ncbi:MAG TPA: hypothetical protein VGM97_15505 [Steroidobacteraceae bacterium]
MKVSRHIVRSAAMIAALLAAGGVKAANHDLQCTLDFRMATWSIIYKSSTGTGTIRCSNGQSLHVKLRAQGGGLTAGKSVEQGHGDFSPVGQIDDLLGGYAAAQAHAGAVNSVQAQVMTKGEVSLAVTGKGHGWSLGIDFGELKIER